jgi:CRP-like cAMP-binding protein
VLTSYQEFSEKFPELSAHISAAEINTLLSTLEESHLAAGEIIIHDNSSSDTLFFIVDGKLSSYIEVNGKKIELGELNPGDIAGEVSLFGNCPTTASVITIANSRILKLHKADLEKLQEISPEFLSHLLRTISKILATRLLTSDKLLYQFLSIESEQPGIGHTSFIEWCTELYQRIHRHPEMPS